MKHPIDLPDEWSEEDRPTPAGWWILAFAFAGFFLAAVIIAWLS